MMVSKSPNPHACEIVSQATIISIGSEYKNLNIEKNALGVDTYLVTSHGITCVLSQWHQCGHRIDDLDG